MADQVLRLPEVRNLTGLSRATIYARQNDGTFPKSINLGPRTVGWLANEVADWIKERVALSRPNH